MPSSLANALVKAILHSPLRPLLGSNVAVITVFGRKTGARYSTPVNVQRDDGSFTVISSRDRTWWRNLRRGAPGSLRVSGKDFAVAGEVLEGRAEVAEALRKLFAREPCYAGFFGVALTPSGVPAHEDLDRLASERVVIVLKPRSAG
jgi:deazaflavin-dependent oxidoreductase (nitroreductase family)